MVNDKMRNDCSVKCIIRSFMFDAINLKFFKNLHIIYKLGKAIHINKCI